MQNFSVRPRVRQANAINAQVKFSPFPFYFSYIQATRRYVSGNPQVCFYYLCLCTLHCLSSAGSTKVACNIYPGHTYELFTTAPHHHRVPPVVTPLESTPSFLTGTCTCAPCTSKSTTAISFFYRWNVFLKVTTI